MSKRPGGTVAERRQWSEAQFDLHREQWGGCCAVDPAIPRCDCGVKLSARCSHRPSRRAALCLCRSVSVALGVADCGRSLFLPRCHAASAAVAPVLVAAAAFRSLLLSPPMQTETCDTSPLSPSRSMTSGARSHNQQDGAASVALLAAAAAARPVLPACSAGNGAGMAAAAPAASPPPSASPSLIRIAIYFNVKKRRAFLDPLFGAQQSDGHEGTTAAYDIERHPITGQRCNVEIVIIENEEEMDTRVREPASSSMRTQNSNGARGRRMSGR